MRILKARGKEFKEFLERLAGRGQSGYEAVEGDVREILRRIRKEGDRALFDLTRRLEGWNPTARTLAVSQPDRRRALKSLPRAERSALEAAARQIEVFHILQRQNSWSWAQEDGTILGQVIRPLERVGIYVPGGKAAYPSSVLMNAIPAKVAGVPEIIMACPAPGGELSPAVLAAAQMAGVDKIFKMGGAQAIAALAYGTKTVPKVDKIVGPGNRYVAAAKRLVFGEVAIEAIAGPSEILIVSDGSGDPAVLAADLLSQAEHDEQASAVLICLSRPFAGRVRREVEGQLRRLPRRKIAAQALENFGAILIEKDLAAAARISNILAPEHLELAVADPFALLPEIRHAGAIFLGLLSAEAIGDYAAGPNHVLPTGGTARFSSPLGVYDFIKRSSLICLSPAGLQRLSGPALRLARLEKLEGHRRAIAKRKITARLAFFPA